MFITLLRVWCCKRGSCPGFEPWTQSLKTSKFTALTARTPMPLESVDTDTVMRYGTH